MNRPYLNVRNEWADFPRASGDEPNQGTSLAIAQPFSPREWG